MNEIEKGGCFCGIFMARAAVFLLESHRDMEENRQGVVKNVIFYKKFISFKLKTPMSVQK